MLSSLRKWWNGSPNASNRAPRYGALQLEALEGREVPALVVTSDTPANLVQNLVGSGITVSNVQYQGTSASSGAFTGGNGIIGFDSGIILSTGTAADVKGPNNDTGKTTVLGTPGDSDLDAIVAPDTTSDATVLQFDFVPQGDQLTFNYVFSSEEYNEYVNAGFKDVFAFFLNGQNVALVPGTNTPINIDTVNNNVNSQFYIDNTDGHLDTQMDGLTTVLTITATVKAGQTNHIKLAIADVGDSLLDSNVFIQAGSFSAPKAPVFTTYYPFRYAFRTLAPATFEGNLTILNTGTAAGSGTMTVSFPSLPAGVTLLNAMGVDPATGNPFITGPTGQFPVGAPVRIPITLFNPYLVPMSTFYLGFGVQVNVA